MFFGKNHFAESIALLFENEKGASRALAFMKSFFPKVIPGLEAVEADGLGDESWGFAGVFFPKAPPGAFYGWRRGNVILLLNISPSTAAAARTVADGVDARAD